MLYYIAIKDLALAIEKYWKYPMTPISREGLFPHNQKLTDKEGESQLGLDIVRGRGVFVNGINIRTKNTFIATITGLIHSNQCHPNLLKEFFSFYDQDVLDPLHSYIGLCLSPELSIEPEKYEVHNQKVVHIETSLLETKVIVTSYNYAHPYFSKEKDLQHIPIPGKVQVHLLVTPFGFQLLGIMTNSLLLRDMLTSLKMITKKEFFTRLAKETPTELKSAKESGSTEPPSESKSSPEIDTDILLRESLIKQLDHLRKNSGRKFHIFIEACERLLKQRLDEFWLLLIEQLIQYVPNTALDFSLPQLFKPEKKNGISSQKKKNDIVTEIDEGSSFQAARVTVTMQATQTDRYALSGLIEKILSHFAKEKPQSHLFRCMQLYLQSSMLPYDALGIFTEFTRQYCNKEELNQLQQLSQTSDSTLAAPTPFVKL